MRLEIPDEGVPHNMTAEKLQVELAVYLFREEQVTLGQASTVAGMKQPAFQQILAERKIALHYGVDELREDVRTLRESRVR